MRCMCIFYNKCISIICFTLKILVKVMQYNIHNGITRWEISTPIIVVFELFCWLSPFSRFSYLKIDYLEEVGQGHNEQYLQCRHSMTNTRFPIWCTLYLHCLQDNRKSRKITNKYFENEDICQRVEKQNLRNSIRNNRIRIVSLTLAFTNIL